MHSLTQTLSILFISTLTEDPRVPVVPFRTVHGRGAGGLPPGGDADGAEAGQLQLRVHAQDAAVYPKPQHDGEIPGGLRQPHLHLRGRRHRVRQLEHDSNGRLHLGKQTATFVLFLNAFSVCLFIVLAIIMVEISSHRRASIIV